MKHQRKVILYGLLSLLFFALFLWRQSENQLQRVEAVNWDDLALTGALVTIEAVDLHRSVVQINLTDGARTVLFDLPERAWLEGVAASSGGLLLTYAPPPSPEVARYSQTNLYRLATDDEPRLLLTQHYPDEVFTQPVVSADGSVYFTRQQPSANGYTMAVERYHTTGEVKQIAEDAFWPAPSPDGQHVAYIAYDAATTHHTLMIADADGTNSLTLLDGTRFTDISAPFFSTDGRQIYFAASETLTAAAHNPLFGVGTTSAHSGDIALANWWRISADGGEPERLTLLATVVQRGVFSPDGAWIAFSAIDGVYVMSPDGAQVFQVAAFAAGESIAWVR